jgi:hypothetical protein
MVFEVLTDRPEPRVLLVGEYRDVFVRDGWHREAQGMPAAFTTIC